MKPTIGRLAFLLALLLSNQQLAFAQPGVITGSASPAVRFTREQLDAYSARRDVQLWIARICRIYRSGPTPPRVRQLHKPQIAATIAVKVDATGSTSDLSVHQSSGDQLLDQQIMDSMRGTKVEPPPIGLPPGETLLVGVTFDFKITRSPRGAICRGLVTAINAGDWKAVYTKGAALEKVTLTSQGADEAYTVARFIQAYALIKLGNRAGAAEFLASLESAEPLVVRRNGVPEEMRWSVDNPVCCERVKGLIQSYTKAKFSAVKDPIDDTKSGDSP